MGKVRQQAHVKRTAFMFHQAGKPQEASRFRIFGFEFEALSKRFAEQSK